MSLSEHTAGCPAIREIREIREKSGNLVVVWKSQGKIREKRPFLRSQGKLKKYEKKSGKSGKNWIFVWFFNT